MKMKLGDQFEEVKVTFLSRPAFPGACITHDLHRLWVPFVFDIAFMNKLFLDEIVMEEIWSTADALEIQNHSGSWLSMMEAFSPLCMNFIEQMMLQFKTVDHSYMGISKTHLERNSIGAKSVLWFHCHIIIATHVMSCYYCLGTCNSVKIQILYSFQASLTTDLTGTIGMLKEKLGGAVDALKNALPNNERKRSCWRILLS